MEMRQRQHQQEVSRGRVSPDIELLREIMQDYKVMLGQEVDSLKHLILQTITAEQVVGNIWLKHDTQMTVTTMQCKSRVVFLTKSSMSEKPIIAQQPRGVECGIPRMTVLVQDLTQTCWMEITHLPFI